MCGNRDVLEGRVDLCLEPFFHFNGIGCPDSVNTDLIACGGSRHGIGGINSSLQKFTGKEHLVCSGKIVELFLCVYMAVVRFHTRTGIIGTVDQLVIFLLIRAECVVFLFSNPSVITDFGGIGRHQAGFRPDFDTFRFNCDGSFGCTVFLDTETSVSDNTSCIGPQSLQGDRVVIGCSTLEATDDCGLFCRNISDEVVVEFNGVCTQSRCCDCIVAGVVDRLALFIP